MRVLNQFHFTDQVNFRLFFVLFFMCTVVGLGGNDKKKIATNDMVPEMDLIQSAIGQHNIISKQQRSMHDT